MCCVRLLSRRTRTCGVHSNSFSGRGNRVDPRASEAHRQTLHAFTRQRRREARSIPSIGETYKLRWSPSLALPDAGKLWHDRENEGGGMRRIVQNGVGGRGPPGRSSCRFSGVQIAVETGEIAARNFKAKAVPDAKDVAGRPKIDRERVDFARREGFGGFLGVAILCAQNPFGQVERGTVGINIDKFCSEVGINGGRRNEQLQSHGTSDLKIVIQRRGGVNQNVVALFQSPLVPRAGSEEVRIAAEWPAKGGNGLAGIISELVREFGSDSESSEGAVAVGGVRCAFGV